MIDLTMKFELAIDIKNSLFDESKWLSSLTRLTKELSLSFLWDDLNDNWIIMGSEKERVIMAARHCPLVFVKDPFGVEKIGELLQDRFIIEIVSSFDDEVFCVRNKKIYTCFPWNTEVISPDKFSLEDLFYATH